MSETTEKIIYVTTNGPESPEKATLLFKLANAGLALDLDVVMALQGRPWNDCKGEEKKALRVKFDAIKARAHDTGRSEFERMMNLIGVREA